MTKKGLALGLCALTATGVASAAPELATPKPASLRVMDTSPFVVRGWGFDARERVSILLNAGEDSQARTMVATDGGVFRVSFTESLAACERFSVRAWGSRGSRARVLAPRNGVGCLSTTRGATHSNPSR